MTNFIPIFPIEAVVYPGEKYRLHIADNNYKHLVTDCYGENKPFGVVPVINNQLSEMGTLVHIIEVSEVWEDGRMNIIVEGLDVFKKLELIKTIPDKLYAGAIVSYPENTTLQNPLLTRKILHSLKEFQHLVSFTPSFTKEENELTSYDLAHYAGLSIQEEYELLELLFESQRLEYLRRHLVKTILVLSNIQSMLKRSAQKNDFKNHKSFDF